MQQNFIQISTNQNSVNSIGIIFLPNNPFFIKDQPFYLKKLCGMSILERNISVLNKNGIKNIFILSSNSENLNNAINFDKIKFTTEIKIKSLHYIKEYLYQEKLSNSVLKYAIILNGGVLIDNRIVSSLLNYEEEIIYIKGNKIHSNYTNKNRINVLAGKINFKENFQLVFTFRAFGKRNTNLR